MLRRVALVGTDVSEERIAYIMRMTTIGELGTAMLFLHSLRRLQVTANVVLSSVIFVTLMVEILSSETSVLARATRRNILEDGIVQMNVCFGMADSSDCHNFRVYATQTKHLSQSI
jgi:hypothetical protein